MRPEDFDSRRFALALAAARESESLSLAGTYRSGPASDSPPAHTDPYSTEDAVAVKIRRMEPGDTRKIFGHTVSKQEDGGISVNGPTGAQTHVGTHSAAGQIAGHQIQNSADEETADLGKFVTKLAKSRPASGHTDVTHDSGATVRLFARGHKGPSSQSVTDSGGHTAYHANVPGAAYAAMRDNAFLGSMQPGDPIRPMEMSQLRTADGQPALFDGGRFAVALSASRSS